MTPLDSIEERYGFSYPPLYGRLFAEGLLDLGQTGPTWMTGEFPRLRLRPPLLLYSREFELMPVEDIAEEIAETLNPDSRHEIREGLRLIPFAMSGGGDLACFHLNAATEAGVPIVHVRHDLDEATFRARNLQDFMLRGLLEAVTDIQGGSLILNGDFGANARALLGTHGPFLTAHQRAVLAVIYRRDLTTHLCVRPQGEAAREIGLLSSDELARLLRAEIGFGQLDQSFSYMQGG